MSGARVALLEDALTVGDLEALVQPRWFPSPADVAGGAEAFERVRRPVAVADRAISLLGPWAADSWLCSSEREMVEGPHWWVEVAPGVVSIRRRDFVRRMRSLERRLALRQTDVRLLSVDEEDLERADRAMFSDEVRQYRDMLEFARLCARSEREGTGSARVITSWSSRSRARMVQRLAELDYTGLLEDGAVPAMVTLTYPGEWRSVCPSGAVAYKHLDTLQKRFRRRWGVKLVAVWKREFQRRGAPHFHLLMVPPAADGRGSFRDWLSQTWADIVDHQDEKERSAHVLAGTGIDYHEGARVLDPKRLGVYFAKHGSFSDKEYQNQAPREWLHERSCEASDCAGCLGESIGRFWGYWGLRRAVESVELGADQARTVMRTLRRYSDRGAVMVRVPVWRKKYTSTVDPVTGEVVTSWRWKKRYSKKRVKRLRQESGYLVVNDGPALARSLARVLVT